MSDAAVKKMGDAIAAAVTKATAGWAKQRKAEERDRSRLLNRRTYFLRIRQTSAKEAAYAVMEKAYLKASANGTLPAGDRQVMYAARAEIQEKTGKPLDDQYFTQTLLPDYIAEYGVDWNVVFDDRGHFTEPHTKREIGIGTLAVRAYFAGNCEPQIHDAKLRQPQVRTSGAAGNFGAVLFVEKEGFMPLFEHVQLGQRFDLAIMSSKGMATTAARRLVETLCGDSGVPLFVLHDFDKAGFSIAATLGRDTRRYQFENTINIIDIGLRLDDVRALGLEGAAEETFDRGSSFARRENLIENDATSAEIEFLLEKRVELNALPSDELVAFVERKLAEHGVAKVVPDDDMLADTYRAFILGRRLQEIFDREFAKVGKGDIVVPAGLREKVEARLKEHPAWRWDDAVRKIARSDRNAEP
jgi:hypothetical protein